MLLGSIAHYDDSKPHILLADRAQSNTVEPLDAARRHIPLSQKKIMKIKHLKQDDCANGYYYMIHPNGYYS